MILVALNGIVDYVDYIHVMYYVWKYLVDMTHEEITLCPEATL